MFEFFANIVIFISINLKKRAFFDKKKRIFKKLETIAIFGGTFDPVHNGHIAIATSILEKNLADRLVILPSFTPPHKQNRVITDFSHRMAMLKIAFKEWNNIEKDQDWDKNTGEYTIYCSDGNIKK